MSSDNSELAAVPWITRHWFWRLFLELLAGALFSLIEHIVFSQFPQPLVERLFEGARHALIALLALELCHTAFWLERVEGTIHRSLKLMQNGIDSLAVRVLNDERILVARDEPKDSRRDISVVTVEGLDEGRLPPVLKKLSDASPPWTVTISLLRMDRLQDLLFSPSYLNHFLTLHKATAQQRRVLIVNDRPRSKAALCSFLQMSTAQDIDTYVYLKSEFYGMLFCIEEHLAATKALEIRKILEGQPDLSLMFSEPQLPAVITSSHEYLLRYDCLPHYGERGIAQFGRHLGRAAPQGYLNCVYKLMRVAASEDSRKGSGNLAAILAEGGPNRTNPWKCDKSFPASFLSGV